MTITTLAWLTAASLCASNDTSPDLAVKVLSFNVRYGTANDGPHAWPHRRELVCSVIRKSQADFCGVQEALRFQLDAIREALPEFAEHGVGRDDGATRGEYSSILYRRDRWRLLAGETLWLSDTPHQAGSKSWGNRLPRIVTWGRFADRRSGQVICVFNVHLDHESEASRTKSASFLAELVARESQGAPVVLTGDFNAGEKSATIERLTQPRAGEVTLVDTFRLKHPAAKQVGTFHGFRGGSAGDKIDYVFATSNARVISAEILPDRQGPLFPSDHYPVAAELVFADVALPVDGKHMP